MGMDIVVLWVNGLLVFSGEILGGKAHVEVYNSNIYYMTESITSAACEISLMVMSSNF